MARKHNSRLGKGSRVDAQGRNTTERFIMLPHWLIDSDAYAALSGDGAKLANILLRRFNGQNNGYISLSTRECEKYDIGRNRAARAFTELEAIGFIVQTKAASWKSQAVKTAREWRLTWLPAGDQPATKEFMGWHKGGTANEKPRHAGVTTCPAAVPGCSRDRDTGRQSVPQTGRNDVAGTGSLAQGRDASSTPGSGASPGIFAAAPPQADHQQSDSLSPSSSQGPEERRGPSPSPGRPSAAPRPPEALQQAPGASSSTDLDQQQRELPMPDGPRQRAPSKSEFLQVRDKKPELWTFIAGRRRGGMGGTGWPLAVRQERPPLLVTTRIDHENVIICARVAMAFDLEFKQTVERLKITSGKSISDAGAKILEARQAGKAPTRRWLEHSDNQISRLHDLLLSDPTSIYCDSAYQDPAARAVA